MRHISWVNCQTAIYTSWGRPEVEATFNTKDIPTWSKHFTICSLAKTEHCSSSFISPIRCFGNCLKIRQNLPRFLQTTWKLLWFVLSSQEGFIWISPAYLYITLYSPIFLAIQINYSNWPVLCESHWPDPEFPTGPGQTRRRTAGTEVASSPGIRWATSGRVPTVPGGVEEVVPGCHLPCSIVQCWDCHGHAA